MDNNIQNILDLNHVLDHAVNNNYGQRRTNQRVKYFDISDSDFKKRFRFSKASVHHLTDILRDELVIERQNMRGRPFSAEYIVCSGLDIMGGGQFQRIEGVCSSSSTSSAHNMLYKFVGALLTIKDQVIHMPTQAMKERNSQIIWEKYNMWNVTCGIDGCHIPFDGIPR